MTTGTDDTWPAGFEIPYDGPGVARRARPRCAAHPGMIEMRFVDDMGTAAAGAILLAPLAGIAVCWGCFVGLGMILGVAMAVGLVATSAVFAWIVTMPLNRAGREIVQWARDATDAPDDGVDAAAHGGDDGDA